MSIITIMVQVIGGIGLISYFTGLMGHYANRIQPFSIYSYPASSVSRNEHLFHIQSINNEYMRDFRDSESPFWHNGAPHDHSFEDPFWMNNRAHPGGFVEHSNFQFGNNRPSNPTWRQDRLNVEYVAHNPMWNQDGHNLNRDFQFGSGTPGYSETGYLVMAVPMSDIYLGFSIAGLAIYLIAGIALLALSYSSPFFVKYTILLSSTFIVGFMYFVTKLAVDGISYWTSSKSNEALFIPLSFMFVSFLVACWALWSIPDFAGSGFAVNVTAKTLFTISILLGCLFFPMGVFGLVERDRFDAGIGLLGASFALGVIGGIVAYAGRITSNIKPMSPTEAEHLTVPFGEVVVVDSQTV